MQEQAGRETPSKHLLSSRQVKALTKPGRYADGGKLYLQVQGTDRVTKSWIFRYVSASGRRREMGLGSLERVGLEAARAEAAKCCRMLERGLDPIDQRKVEQGQAVLSDEGCRVAPVGRSRQASKSRRKRLDILDATLDCLAKRPYPEVTIAAVAEHAGISKGGIQYHFPSRYELLRDAIARLFQRRLDAYRADLQSVPDGVATTDYIIDHHWKHLTEPEFQIYQELVVASRSDDRLRKLLVERYRTFRREWGRASLAAFGWDERDPEVVVLGNIAQYLMDGMAYGWLVDQLREKDVERLLAFVKGIMREGVRHGTPHTVLNHVESWLD